MVTLPSGDLDLNSPLPELSLQDYSAASGRQERGSGGRQSLKLAAGTLQEADSESDSSEEADSSDEWESSEEHAPAASLHRPAISKQPLINLHGSYLIMSIPSIPPPVIDEASANSASEAVERNGVLLGYDGSCFRVPYAYGVVKCNSGGDECFFARLHLSPDILASQLIVGDPLRFRIKEALIPGTESEVVSWAYNIRRVTCNRLRSQSSSLAPKYHHKQFAGGVLVPVEAPAPTAPPATKASPPSKAMRFEPPWSPKLEEYSWWKKEQESKNLSEERAAPARPQLAEASTVQKVQQKQHGATKRELDEVEKSFFEDAVEGVPEERKMPGQGKFLESPGLQQGSVPSLKRRCWQHRLPEQSAGDGDKESNGTAVQPPAHFKPDRSKTDQAQRGAARKAPALSTASNDKSKGRKSTSRLSAVSAKVSGSPGDASSLGQNKKERAAPLTLPQVIRALLEERCTVEQWSSALAAFHGTSLTAMLDAELVHLQRVICEEATVLGCAAPKICWHGVVLE